MFCAVKTCPKVNILGFCISGDIQKITMHHTKNTENLNKKLLIPIDDWIDQMVEQQIQSR